MTAQFSFAGNLATARSFDDRLRDFAPELASFLRQAWNQRSGVASGAIDLYDLYTGDAASTKVSYEELKNFIKRLSAIHPPASIFVQDYPQYGDFTALDTLTGGEIKMHRHVLAQTFYHCMGARGSALHRIYVHATGVRSGLDILQEVVGQFPRLPGICEAKIGGPAAIGRADTIVIYFSTQEASDELLAALKDLHKRLAGAFAPGVPALVKEVAPGIGTTSEPPKIEILPGGGSRHSFGSFYCDLISTAIKNVPNIQSATVDGRHMLDNLLWSLRLLGIEPRDHLAFPERDKLEAYQQALQRKPAPRL
jgi:hypothetical protein